MGSRQWCSVAAILFALGVSGCATHVQRTELKTALEVPEGKTSKPIQFKRIVVKLDRGAVIGKQYDGLLEVPSGNLVWRGGRMNWSGDELTEVFRDELERFGYTVVGDPDALFDDPAAWKAELLVAGLVTDMQATAIYPWAGYGNYSKSKGEAYMKVEWQVYSRLNRQVVQKTVTEGTGVVKKARNLGAEDCFFDAFAMSVHNLLADKDFHNLVVSQSPEINVSVPKDLTLSPPEVYTATLSEHLNDVRSAVATVYAGDGHGSGFFLDARGYLLTNEHVVRQAKLVKIKLASGREILGEVVRTSAPRDTALIKVEEQETPALPIRRSDVAVADEVFAIGTPLGEGLSTTVSKGIVSAFREMDGVKFIQSDVNIQPGNSGGPLVDKDGNVIGIAAMGLSSSGAMTGVNFFIPIIDALGALGVAIGE